MLVGAKRPFGHTEAQHSRRCAFQGRGVDRQHRHGVMWLYGRSNDASDFAASLIPQAEARHACAAGGGRHFASIAGDAP